MAHTMLTRLGQQEYNTGDMVEVQHESEEEAVSGKKVALQQKFSFKNFSNYKLCCVSQTWYRAIIVSKLDSKNKDKEKEKFQIKWINFPTAKTVDVLASRMRPVLTRTLRSDSLNGLHDNDVKIALVAPETFYHLLHRIFRNNSTNHFTI